MLIASIAARSEATARAYAKKHKIPNVHPTYEALIADPSIDAVYVPLPNGLHYEWTTKALAAGKHVLLEKPSTSNAEEAKALFAPYAKTANPSSAQPVLLEAFHSLFHPAFRKFISLVDGEKVGTAYVQLSLPKGIFSGPHDIRFNFQLGGGAMLDCGTYCIQALRKIFRAEPVECLEATAKKATFPGSAPEIDEGIEAKLRFPNGGTGSLDASLRRTGNYRFPWLTSSWPAFWAPVAKAREMETVIEDPSVGVGKEHAINREVTLWNFIVPFVWHRIDILETHVVRTKSDRKVVKSWVEKKVLKDYGPQGREWWSTYRWQLEAFVDKIKGRDRVGVWVHGQDSIKQMEAIDMVYEKSGLPLRPTTQMLSK